MEGLEKLKGSQEAYRSHLMCLLAKLEELDLSQPANDEILTGVERFNYLHAQLDAGACRTVSELYRSQL